MASHRGDLVSGVVVMAFGTPGPTADDRPVASSEPTDQDGRYRLILPPGRYYLLALRSAGRLWPPIYRAGDLYCYYLGNPIPVEDGKMTRVGFNMIGIPESLEVPSGKETGVAGQVLFENRPLGRSYVYVYRDGASNFRGMGMSALPTDEEGRFRLRLAPGSYYLLARKRKAGGMYGPPLKDDHIGYFYGNPIQVREGETRVVSLETTTRIDLLEEMWFPEDRSVGWFEGTVVDGGAAPVEGLYVLFYSGSDITGTPSFVAGPTGSDGRFRARAAPGMYRLVARGSVGGPPAPGEWFGLFQGPGGVGTVDASSGKEIRIVVSPAAPP